MTKAKTIKLGLIQHACIGGALPDAAARRRNLDTACDMIREAASKGAQLIATQELFTSTYFPQVEDDSRFELAEPIPGPTTDRLCALADELGVWITASLFEKRAAGVYHNTSVMIGPGTGPNLNELSSQGPNPSGPSPLATAPGSGPASRIVGKYRKMHIPDDPRFYEKYYFTPGDLGFQTHEVVIPAPSLADSLRSGVGDQTEGIPAPSSLRSSGAACEENAISAGMLVCWDQWFPEAARLTAMRGAQVLFYPTAIGWHESETPTDRTQQKEAWRTIQRSHAIANGVFVAAINRVGVEGELMFWGSSFVADPGGVVIAEASGTEPEVLVVECDLGRIEEIRRGWPFWRDRRIDAYESLTRRLWD